MKLDKKNKTLVLFLIIIILIIICSSILNFSSIDYKLNVDGNKIKVKEIVEKNNYYIEIKTNKKVYPFRIYNDLNNKRKVVKDIYYYNDKNIECILPVINNNLYTDITCSKDGILYDYYNIVETNINLDKYVESIGLYNLKNYQNKSDDIKIIDTINYYVHKNLNKITSVTTYNGLIINDKQIKLFDTDIYNNKLSAYVNKYYIIADYNNKYTFDLFYIINLETKKITKIESKNDISYDSYIQGIVDNKVYLYDKDNENQYEIDIENKSIKIISNKNYIKYYRNTKWEKLNKRKANKEIYFDYETLDNKFASYDYVEETDEFYYLYKKDGISYELYRLDKNNMENYKYILNVPTTNIKFNQNYLYYVYKDKLYFYSDNTGLKTILQNSELEFNETIKYYIY